MYPLLTKDDKIMKYIRTKDRIYELMFPNEEQQMSFDHKTIEPAYYTAKSVQYGLIKA